MLELRKSLRRLARHIERELESAKAKRLAASHRAPATAAGASQAPPQSQPQPPASLLAPETRVAAPYMPDWGMRDYHEALVEEVDVARGRCTVMFLYPLHPAMAPCRAFLDGRCKEGDDGRCRYSHGYEVRIAELRTPPGVSASELGMGSACIYRENADDDYWHYGRLSGLKTDARGGGAAADAAGGDGPLTWLEVAPLSGGGALGHRVQRLPLGLVRPTVVAAEEAVRRARAGVSMLDDAALSEASDGDGSDGDANGDSAAAGAAAVVAREPVAAPSGAFGAWEAFSNGFGSRMLARLGYKRGQGLGKDGSGRVEPVPVTILPQGELARPRACRGAVGVDFFGCGHSCCCLLVLTLLQGRAWIW